MIAQLILIVTLVLVVCSEAGTAGTVQANGAHKGITRHNFMQHGDVHEIGASGSTSKAATRSGLWLSLSPPHHYFMLIAVLDLIFCPTEQY